MTVAAAPRKIYFPDISGGTGPYAFTFRIIVELDNTPRIDVTKINGTTRTPLVYATDYTFVAASLGLSGGAITLLVTGVAGDSLLIEGATPVNQLVGYANLGSFSPERHELSYDKLTMIVQEVEERNNLALTLNPESSETPPTFEDPTDGSVPIYDAASNQYLNGPTASEITSAQSYASAASDSADAALASQLAAEAAANGMKYRAVRVASTADVTIASAPSSIDGVTLASNDRILLKNQSAPAENGLYAFNGAGSALTRTTDGDTWDELVAVVAVASEGSTNADKGFLCTSDAGGTLGSTSVTFADWQSLIFNNTLANSKLVQVATATFKGRSTAGTGDVEDMTATQATALLNAMVGDSGSGGTKGLVPAPSAGDAATKKFLAADGTWYTRIYEGGTQATSSGTTFDFSSIPSWVTHLEIIFAGNSLSGTDHFLIQLGDAGGLENSGYVSSAELGGAVSTSTAGFVVHNSGAANVHNGVITIDKIGGTTWVAAGVVRNASSTGGTASGTKTLTEALDRVRVLATGANTFDAGNIAVRGW